MKNLLNKKEGELLARDYVVILVLFGVVVALLYLVTADMASNYNVPNMTDANFQKNYDTLSSSTDSIYKIQTSLNSSEGMSTVSPYFYTFKATFSIISILLGSFSSVNTVFSNFAIDFGVPSIIANIFFPAVVVIMIVVLIFIIVGSINGHRI
jgi:hypothetical protein